MEEPFQVTDQASTKTYSVWTMCRYICFCNNCLCLADNSNVRNPGTWSAETIWGGLIAISHQSHWDVYVQAFKGYMADVLNFSFILTKTSLQNNMVISPWENKTWICPRDYHVIILEDLHLGCLSGAVRLNAGHWISGSPACVFAGERTWYWLCLPLHLFFFMFLQMVW